MNHNANRAWAEINLSAIAHNYREVVRHTNGRVLCIVKANAYGHGAVQVAQRLASLDAAYFAVATVSEAIALREAGIQTPILVLGYLDAADMEDIVRYHITATICEMETARALSAEAERLKTELPVHFKVDTGMTRLGFPAWEATTVDELLACAQLPYLKAEGMFTHFAAADTDDADSQAYTQTQFSQFLQLRQTLEARGLARLLCHCSNSGGLTQFAQMNMDMVRAGIVLYGYSPDPALASPLNLRPAMTVKAKVVQVKQVPPHTSISYGRTYETQTQARVAVIAMGYADGYLRAGSNRAKILLGDMLVPVVGRICMDMCIVQLPHGLEVHKGDEAIIFGADCLTADDVARSADTISYEVLCALSERIPRMYFD